MSNNPTAHRNAHIVAMRVQGTTFKDIAVIWGICPARVGQICRAYRHKNRKAIPRLSLKVVNRAVVDATGEEDVRDTWIEYDVWERYVNDEHYSELAGRDRIKRQRKMAEQNRLKLVDDIEILEREILRSKQRTSNLVIEVTLKEIQLKDLLSAKIRQHLR